MLEKKRIANTASSYFSASQQARLAGSGSSTMFSRAVHDWEWRFVALSPRGGKFDNGLSPASTN
jgi:hypothetical protein